MSDRPMIYGIDLGTTYSCIAVINDVGRAEVLVNSEGDQTTPSVVYFEEGGNIVVGKVAKNTSKLYPGRTVSLIKREMGNPDYSFSMDGKDYRPEEISSFILRKIVDDAASQRGGGQPITDVVITCPAYFGISQRKATEAAGQLAGLTVHRVVNEPTAAAFFYGATSGEDQVVLVYDLGGGTFDITLIEVKDGGVRVICTDGDFRLGGQDWDEVLMNYLGDQFMAINPGKGDPRDDVDVLQALAIETEEIKRGLTAKEKSAANISFNGAKARIEVTRTKFEELTAHLLERTMELTAGVIEEGRKAGIEHIDRILLVGGSSFMPQVAARLSEAFTIPFEMFEPNLAVAKGAAMVGAKILAGEMIIDQLPDGALEPDGSLNDVDEEALDEATRKAVEGDNPLRLAAKDLKTLATLEFHDVCSKSFGVVQTNRDMTESVVFLIHNNTKVPQEVTQTFGTLKANQRSVHVRIMEQLGQVESTELEHNRLITDGELTGLPSGLPAGAPIHITFGLEADGQLDVFAVEPTSGAELRLQTKLEGVMSAEEIEESKGILLNMQVS
jgi:molecular chaperone DnaK